MYVLSPYYWLLLFASCIVYCVIPLVLLWCGFVLFNTRRSRKTEVLDPRWDTLSGAEWDAFALAWIAELSGNKPTSLPRVPSLFADDPNTRASDLVVSLCLTASAESQWCFINSMCRLGSGETTGHLVAGLVDQLLSTHGESYIEQIEKRAYSDPRFARMLTGCQNHLMSDALWNRICAASSQVS